MRRFKIVHTVCHGQWGGLERRVFNESRWMMVRGHQVTLIVPKESPLFEKATAEGLPVHDMAFTRSGMVRDLFCLRRLLKDIRPDVLNTHGNTDTKVGLAAAKGMGIPCVILSRHVTPAVRNSWYNRMLYRELCSYVFTTAEAVTRQIVRDLGVDGARVWTIPSGIIPPTRPIQRAEARHWLSSLLNLPSHTRYIGFVGRLSPEKGISDLLEAFVRIKEIHPRHHLVLVGDGGFRKDLETLILEKKLNGQVHLMGYQVDPWPFYHAFDCNVLPSAENEGIPQVILEAMFARCPVIGTNVGGIPDVIRHKQTGSLVRPKHPDALASEILRTLAGSDTIKLQTEAAFQFVQKGHTLNRMGEKILDIYMSALSASP